MIATSGTAMQYPPPTDDILSSDRVHASPSGWAQFFESHLLRHQRCRDATTHAELASLMKAWRFAARPGLLLSLLKDISIPDSPDIRLLVGWSSLALGAEDHAFESRGLLERRTQLVGVPFPDSGQERDRILFAKVSPRQASEADRKAAVLSLLARLGEEFRLREDQAWVNVKFPSHPEDIKVREILASVSSNTPDFKAIYAFKKRFGSRVRVAFSGVGTMLRLPPHVIQEHADQAVEQLDMFLLGARFELLSRILETKGEPIASLASGLGPQSMERVVNCVARRETWQQAFDVLDAHGGRPDFEAGLAEASELAVFLRLLESATEGQLPTHALGLPGWGVVSANRSRMRGRLRAAAATAPDILREKTLLLPSLYERTGAALARQALDWAWREARAGFGFDPSRVHPTTCDTEDPSAPVRSRFGKETEPALKALLLLLLGRGCEDDLIQWMAGASSGSLSKSFYRCLRQAPDMLADPMEPGQRVRRYAGLCEHLAGGGFEAMVPALLPAAERAAVLKPGRSLKEQLHAALAPDWDEHLIPLPGHHLPGFCEALATFWREHGRS